MLAAAACFGHDVAAFGARIVYVKSRDREQQDQRLVTHVYLCEFSIIHHIITGETN